MRSARILYRLRHIIFNTSDVYLTFGQTGGFMSHDVAFSTLVYALMHSDARSAILRTCILLFKSLTAQAKQLPPTSKAADPMDLCTGALT